MRRKLKCKYCNKFCFKQYRDSLQQCWHCKQCNVDFYTSKNNIQTIKFVTVKENDKYYRIWVSFKYNETSIYLINNNGTNIVTRFNNIINFTPNNLKNKLKTYLLFL